MADEMVDRNAFTMLANYLSSIGLGSLFSYTNGQPSGWLWEQVKEGIVSQEALQMALEQTPKFRQRFAVLFEMRDNAMRSGGGYVPTVKEVVEYEESFFRTMAAAGLPSWFYDDLGDAHKALRSNLSVSQIADRIEAGYSTVQAMPDEVRNVFDEYYGPQGDQALLAAVLDPQKTMDEIDRAVRTAQVGGYLRQQGFNMGRDKAEVFAQPNLSEAEIRAVSQEAGRLRGLTQETIGEGAMDLTEESAVTAAFGTNVQDEQRLEERLTRRQLGQRAISGGAITGQSGISGASVV